MRHMLLFKGCFDYIRDFLSLFFPFAANIKPVFVCLSVSIEMHLLQFGLVPLIEAGAWLWFTAAHKPTILM